MHKALHPCDYFDRLYASRKERERGLARMENSVDTTIQRLEDYSKKSRGGKLIKATGNNIDNTRINNKKNNQKSTMGRKATVWILQTKNKQKFTQKKKLDLAKEGEP